MSKTLADLARILGKAKAINSLSGPRKIVIIEGEKPHPYSDHPYHIVLRYRPEEPDYRPQDREIKLDMKTRILKSPHGLEITDLREQDED